MPIEVPWPLSGFSLLLRQVAFPSLRLSSVPDSAWPIFRDFRGGTADRYLGRTVRQRQRAARQRWSRKHSEDLGDFRQVSPTATSRPVISGASSTHGNYSPLVSWPRDSCQSPAGGCFLTRAKRRRLVALIVCDILPT